MQNEPAPVEIPPESELSTRLRAAAGKPVLITAHGVTYRVTRDAHDLWADYDPERAARAVEQSAGILRGAGVAVAQRRGGMDEERTQDSTGRPA